MFDAIRARYLYNRLLHEKGARFIDDTCSLAGIGTEDAVRYLLDLVVTRNDLTNNEKSALVTACASIGHTAARYLMNEIYDEHGTLQYGVVSALGSMREYEAVPIFIFLLEETDNPVFARSLGEIGDPEAETVLRGKLLDPASHCRMESMEALAKISIENSADIFLHIMKTGYFTLQQKAAQLLAGAGYVCSLPGDQLVYDVLRENRDDCTVDLPEKAEALACFASCFDQELLEHSITLLAHAAFTGRIKTLASVIQEYTPASICRFFSLLHPLNDDEQPAPLFDFLKHEDPKVRAAAEEYLSRQKSTAVIHEAIRRLFSESSTDMLYQAALESIAVACAASHPAVVEACLSTDDPAEQMILLDILGTIGKNSSRASVEAVCRRTDNPEVVLYGAWALGQIGCEASVPVLLHCIEYPDQEVRLAACEAYAQCSTSGSIEDVAPYIEKIQNEDEKRQLYRTVRQDHDDDE